MATKQVSRSRQIIPSKGLLLLNDAKSLIFDEDVTGPIQPRNQRSEADKKTILAPRCHPVEDYESDQVGNFEMTKSFIRFPRKTDEAYDYYGSPEYSLQLEDERWLSMRPKHTSVSKLTPEMLEMSFSAFENATGFESPISQSEAETLLVSQLHGGKGDIQALLNEIYSYWRQKRARVGKPLLQKFWLPTSANDTDPHKVFRPREKERYKLRRSRVNDIDCLNKMRQLKEDFDQLLFIAELTIAREKIKQAAVEVQQELIEQSVHDAFFKNEGKRQIKMKFGDFKKDIRPALLIKEDDLDVDDGVKADTKNRESEKYEAGESTKASGAEESSNPPPLDQNIEEYVLPSFLDEFNNRKAAEYHLPVTPEPHIMSLNEKIVKYRLQGRVGRGGRLIFDRVPIVRRKSDFSFEETFVISSGPVPTLKNLSANKKDSNESKANQYRVNRKRLHEIFAEPDDQDVALETSVHSLIASVDTCKSVDVPNVQYHISV